MKILYVNTYQDIPEDFTGIVQYNFDCSKEWYLNGEIHREDGPAIQIENEKFLWCLYDFEVTKDMHHRMCNLIKLGYPKRFITKLIENSSESRYLNFPKGVAPGTEGFDEDNKW